LSLAKDGRGIEVLIKKTNEFSKHALYSYSQEDTENEFMLLNNRSSSGHLVPERAHADYLFLIKESYDVNLEELIFKIKSIPFVLTAFEVKVGDLKSKENLLF
jgi:hypothetical protein